MNIDVRLRAHRYLDSFLSLIGILSLVVCVLNFGFYLNETLSFVVFFSLQVIVIGFVLQELVRWFLCLNKLNNLKVRWVENAMGLILLTSLFGQGRLMNFVNRFELQIDFRDIFLAYLGISQLIVFALLIVRKARESYILSKIRMGPARLFTLSFMIPIFLGGLLLKLPKATTEPISWIDAFFTSTSAVCVTGLIVVDTATRFTPFGQLIIGFLIQLGGLGIMTLSMSLGILFSGSLGVKERTLLGDILSEDRMGEVGSLLAQITLLTFSIEIIGALALYSAGGHSFTNFQFAPFYTSLFHSVSAFCNAGFSIFTLGLYDPSVRSNYGFSSIIMVLVVLGGLGFPVISNLIKAAGSKKRRFGQERVLLKIPTKLVVISTFILLVFGTVAIYLTESQASFSSLSTLDRVFQSLFLSVTSRTAGFNIMPVESLHLSTMMVIIFLMWVGGSPMSTAGGIKTITFAVAVLSTKSVITGQGRVEVLGREISQQSVMRSFAIIFGSLALAATGYMTLLLLEPHLPPADLLFEVFSAFGTVGLSRGVTSQLSEAGKILIIMMMFMGRIGILTFLSSFITSRRRLNYKLLKEQIPIS